mgnify:CR=1 FL=1
MNEVKTFENEDFGQIRTVTIDGEPWLVGKDVATALGYSNSRDAFAKHVDAEDKQVAKCDTVRGKQKLTIINESGLYSLILSSKLPSAKKFKRWVTSEVLPSIRKHGAYMNDETLEKAITSPDFLIRLAMELKAAKEQTQSLQTEIRIKDQLIGELKPKADYTDTILNNESVVSVTQIAKDYGYSGQAFNQLLHNLKVQYWCDGQWLLYAKYHHKGYTHSQTYNIVKPGGKEVITAMVTKWTQKGRLFIYNLLKEQDIVPLIELEDEECEEEAAETDEAAE